MKPELVHIDLTTREARRAIENLPAGTWVYRGSTHDEEGWVHRFFDDVGRRFYGVCASVDWRPANGLTLA